MEKDSNERSNHHLRPWKKESGFLVKDKQVSKESARGDAKTDPVYPGIGAILPGATSGSACPRDTRTALIFRPSRAPSVRNLFAYLYCLTASVYLLPGCYFYLITRIILSALSIGGRRSRSGFYCPFRGDSQEMAQIKGKNSGRGSGKYLRKYLV